MMSDDLDKIESTLKEVEDQLLSEFERIRKTLSGEPYSSIGPDVKKTLDENVMGLWQDLEHSGRADEITLRTEQHEDLSLRIIVLKKLLDAKIPTAFLAETKEEIEKSRVKATPGENLAPEEVTAEEHTGFIETIKQFFRGKPAPDDVSRNITGAEKTEQERIGVYLDNVYAASQHLEVLAGRFQTAGNPREMMNAVVSGKAVFDSKELSARTPEVTESKSSDTKAQSPDEIRRKLEGSNTQSGGTSRFDSHELSSTAPGPVRQKKDVAQTPDDIRKKLEARQEDSSSSGKASFGAKDVDPDRSPKKPKPAKAEEIPPEHPTRKAVFESKNLSSKD